MDAHAIAYVTGMGLCLVAGLVLYGTRRLSGERITRFFGAAMLIGGGCNLVFDRTPHPVLPDPLLAAFGFLAVTGFMGLITDGVIFKVWKPERRPSTAAERCRPVSGRIAANSLPHSRKRRADRGRIDCMKDTT